MASTGPIAGLLAVRSPSARDDLVLQWQPDLVANGYNLWYVGRKEDIPLARQQSAPPAIAVSGCAVPA